MLDERWIHEVGNARKRIVGNCSMALGRRLKDILKLTGAGIIRDLVVLLVGWINFRRSGTTPQRSHVALVSLFCQTGGTSNDVIHAFIVRRRPPFRIDGSGVLGADDRELGHVVKQWLERGYYVFEYRLPSHLLD